MPEVITVHALLIGGDKGERRYVEPGRRVNLSQETFDELIQIDPCPIIDPKAQENQLREEQRYGSEASSLVAGVAERVGPEGQQTIMPTATEDRSPARRSGASSEEAGEGNEGLREPADADEL